MLKKFIHVLNLVFEKKMQHPEYFQHVFENKLNLVYLGILVHTQCKIVHTQSVCTQYRSTEVPVRGYYRDSSDIHAY
jgi:hypothetical protein